MTAAADAIRPSGQKFGTFLGVYTPSVLTILGLIMYLRFGFVLGNLGLGLTLLVVLLASSITFITGMSASAIATNLKVGVGGEYYMISHSLGLELGGAIGIPLFFCRTLSITFYALGLSEALLVFWPASMGAMPGYAIQLLAGVIIVTATAVAGRSAGLALKLQIPIMIVVGLSLLALVAGVLGGGVRAPEWAPTYRTAPEGFWYVFAVFFPAVTGFTAGIGMSGDLKDPQRSIPRGTLLAVTTGALIYLTVPVLLAVSDQMDFDALAASGIDSWTGVTLLGGLFVYPAVWGAILSSAFGSVLGGPRVLQALAEDNLAPKFLARLSRTGQPTVATWISGGIALAAVFLGGLNTVAQFVSILFLTLYVIVNLAHALEKFVGDPSYRPRVDLPWYVALLGALGAIGVMFLISPIACVIAVVLELGLYLFLSGQALERRWGDVRAGFWMVVARLALIKRRPYGRDPRNWRPQILVFSGDPAGRLDLVRLAAWFGQQRGVVTACKLIVTDLTVDTVDVEAIRTGMRKVMTDAGLVVFSEVAAVRDFESGAIDVAQASGIVGIKPNTVMFGWSEKQERLESYVRIMRALSKAGRCTVLARTTWRWVPGTRKQIDVWWGGLERNGDLMLLLAHLLTLDPTWADADIFVRSIVADDEEKRRMEERLHFLIPESRIRANFDVVVRSPDRTIAQIMKEHSRDATMVFLGLMDPAPGAEGAYVQRLAEITAGFPTTIFVRNTERSSVPVLLEPAPPPEAEG